MIFLLLIFALTISSADASVSFTPDWQKISGKKILDAEFIDSDENVVHLSDYKDKILILHPMFTRCASTCGFISSRLSTAVKGLSPEERKNIRILSFSFDPEENSQSLAKFTKMFAIDPAIWKVVRAEPAMIQQLLSALDYRTLQLSVSNFEHPNLLFVVGKDRILREYIYGTELTSPRLSLILQSSERGDRALSTINPLIYVVALLGLLVSAFIAVSRISKVQRQSANH